MKSKTTALWTMAALCAAMTISAALVAFGASSRRATREKVPEWMLEITDYLIEVKPLIDQVQMMKDVIMSVKATSPTLERLDELQIKADAVQKLNAALERLEKVEPVLKSLEAMQREFAKRSRTRAGSLPRKPPAWSEIFDRIQTRLDAVEKRLYAPSVLRDPADAQTPVELRLREIEQRQQELAKELESLHKELRRQRRLQRQQMM